MLSIIFNLLSQFNFVFFEFKAKIIEEGLNIIFNIKLCFWSDKIDYLFGFFEKNNLLYFFNIFNFMKYIFYCNIKKVINYIYYYIIQIFLILIYNNMPNKVVNNYLYYYYVLKKNLMQSIKYIMIGYVKKWRFWRSYYRFYHISYLKILFFILFIILFILMWNRKNTYLKRTYIWNFLLFYMLSIFISFLLWPLFVNKCLSIIISLLISFFFIFYRLN